MGFLVNRRVVSDTGLQDWATRIAQPGVLTYTRFDSESDVTDGTLVDGLEDHVTWQTAFKASGTGALRFDVLDADGSNSGNWWFWLKPDQSAIGNGETIYVSYRYYSSEEMWRYMPEPGAGYKLSIISNHDSSSVVNEMVIQNTLYRGYLQAYHQDGSSFPPFEEARSTPCNGGNFSLQNAIDTGSPSSPATCAQYANRYGPIYDYGDANGSPDPGDIAAQGHPRTEASGSGFAIPSNEWISIKIKIIYGTFGSANSTVTVWAARDGDSYTMLMHYTGVLFGNDPAHPVNVLWLLPYETSRTANTKGVDTFVCYDEVIISTADIAAPTAAGPASDLAVLAAGMVSGEWATFSMGGLDASIFHGNSESDQTMGEFAGKMQWDALHKRLVFAGCSHTGGLSPAGSGGLAYWDDATNQWTREECAWDSTGEGHQYAHLAVDPNGNLYRRNVNAPSIKKRAWGSSGCASWLSGQVENFTTGAVQFSGGLEWFPDLNSGNGGLVFIDNHVYSGLRYSNAALSSWTVAGTPTVGDYDINIAYANGFVYCGGGQGSTAFYKLSPSGVVSSLSDLPFSPGTNLGGGYLIPSPNGLGVLLIDDAANGDIRYFNGSSWSDLGSHQIASSPHIAGAVPEYGVIVTVTIDPAGVATPVAKVYKQ